MITGNEPAMPIWFEGNLGQMNSTGGLTIREHFAVTLMQGLLSNSASDIRELGYETFVAEDAVRCADALIKELNKK